MHHPEIKRIESESGRQFIADPAFFAGYLAVEVAQLRAERDALNQAVSSVLHEAENAQQIVGFVCTSYIDKTCRDALAVTRRIQFGVAA